MIFSRRWRKERAQRAEAAMWRARHVAEDAHIDPSVHVLGWRQVRVGRGSVLSADTWLNVNDRAAEQPAIIIGDSCFIGRRNFLSAGARIAIGDYCLTGVDCHFLGADHLHATPFVPYVTTGTTADGAIEIGANCWFGASVTVLKGVTIGFGSILGAGAVITRDVPPFSIAVGNPARVVKRFDAARSEWIAASDFDATAEARIPGAADYLAKLRASHPRLKLPRLAAGVRGGDL